MRKKVAAILMATVLLSLATHYYLDERVPPLPEQWKVKVIDAAMRSCKHVINALVSLGLTTYLSPLDRGLAERALVFQINGWPWQRYHGPNLKVTDTVFSGVSVRMYEPTNTLSDTRRPAVLYMHGGVWSVLSVDTHDAFTAELAIRANVVVISLNYRLSPENPYPAALDDVLAVLQHVQSRGQELRLDPSRLAVAGDSCGGNLAAAAALRAPKQLALQILLVPVLQLLTFNNPSHIENTPYMADSVGDKGALALALAYGSLPIEFTPDVIADRHTSSVVKKSRHYSYVDSNKWLDPEVVRTPELKRRKIPTDFGNATVWNKIKDRFLDPYFMPLMADEEMLRKAPHAYVMTAGYDLIRDDGAIFASRLKSVGVEAEYRNYPDAFHHALLFHKGPFRLQIAEDIVRDLASYVKEHL